MAIDFKVYVMTEREVLGTVNELAQAGGKLKFSQKSLNDKSKQLCVVIERKDGKSATVTCSKAVTAGLRAAMENGTSKKKCLASIMALEVVEAPNGGNYVSAPAGAQGESFTVAELKKESVSFEELVAF